MIALSYFFERPLAMSMVNKTQCSRFLRVKLGHERFKILDFTLTAPKINLGHCSTQTHLSISVQLLDSGRIERVFFFLKIATENEEMNKRFWKPHRFFENEYAAHMKILPHLLNGSSLDDLTARCFFGVEDYLVLEDLNALGFEVARVLKSDWAHTATALKLYAQFHAASFLNYNPADMFKKYEKYILECIYDEEIEKTKENLFASTLKRNRYFIERYYQHKSSAERQRVLSKSRARIIEFMHPSKKYRNVFSHGDAQLRNILFKYNENDAPYDCRLVDFQLLRFVPPITDLFHYLYTSTDASFRRSHENSLFELYYVTLGERLQDVGVELETVLPRDEFFDSVTTYKEFGALIEFFYTFLKLPPETYKRLVSTPQGWINHFLLGDTVFTEWVCDNYASYVETFKQIVDKMFDLYA